MIRKHDGTRQPNSVMPPRPTHRAARRHSCIPLRPHTLLPQRISPTLSPPQSSAAHPRCNSFVSYAPDTTMRRMRRPSDTKKIVPDTKIVARPYLAYDRLPPKTSPPRHDEIRQAPSSYQSPAIQHPFDTCVSYGPDMTIRQIRHLPDTNHLSPDTKNVEMSNVLLSGPTTPTRPTSPLPTTTKSAKPVPPPQSPSVGLFVPIRASYGSGTNGTTFRYEKIRFTYEPSPTPYLRWHRPPPTFPPHTPKPLRRNTSNESATIVIQPLATHIPRHAPALRPMTGNRKSMPRNNQR